MHPNALLDLATELLRAVLKLDAPADGVVSAFFRKHKTLGARERHALAETVYAVLRRRPLYQHLAQSGHGALERRLAILAWQGPDSLLRGALGSIQLFHDPVLEIGGDALVQPAVAPGGVGDEVARP